VVITQFSDFQCPFCQRVEPTINTLLEQYGDRVKLVWRNLPLPMHPDAPIAAEAALEAQRQKGNSGFWAMHAKLFATRDFSMESLHAMAKDIGLDVNAFDAALRDHRHEAAVKRDGAIAEAAGIRGTPAFVINGRFLAGAQPLKKFRRAVERALDEAK
jgi:protein-disulfide isomerase